MTIYTIGHSTRALEVLLALLHAHGIRQLVDVRTVPRSRRHPHFSREALPSPLATEHIDYVHMPGLGGLRTPRPDSINTGFPADGFRGYADYMQTPNFRTSLDALVAHARRAPTAIMCAEAVPSRCHRSLISDALLARGIDVGHIVAIDREEPHAHTPFARRDGARLTYPGAQPNLPMTGL